MPEWTVIVFRAVGAVFILFTLTRILGKRQISQLTFFEYITGITLGELAGFISTDIEKNYFYGVLAILIWFALPFGMELLTLKSKNLRDLLEGKARVLVKDGKVMEDNLKKERLSSDELLELLRTKNVFRMADVEFATMETSGKMSVLLREENQPITPKHLGIRVAPSQEPQAVILDGEIQDEPLSTIGLNRAWLKTELDKIGVSSKNVFLGQVDSYGQLFVDLYDDQLKIPAPQNKELLHAVLKKCTADLELFALSTKDPVAKQSFADCAGLMNEMLDEITPLLKNGA